MGRRDVTERGAASTGGAGGSGDHSSARGAAGGRRRAVPRRPPHGGRVAARPAANRARRLPLVHHLRLDGRDGVRGGGEEGYAVTWMDARVGDLVITPRRGKPIEINALWYNALRLTGDWCERAMRPAGRYRQMAARTYESAQERFWYRDGGYCYDVVDGPDGDDPSLRPNQVIALALVFPLIEGDHARYALDRVTAKLLTPYGLRTLSPDDPRYQSVYRGDQRARDAAYHMGTACPWLLGPYLDAHLRLNGDRETAGRLIEPFEEHLRDAGLGTISEIFEPEPPYRPVGCIAQARSVAEILRHARTIS